MKKSPKLITSLRMLLGCFLITQATSSAAPLAFGPGSPSFGKLQQDGSLKVDFSFNKARTVKEVSATTNGVVVDQSAFVPFSTQEEDSVSILYLIDVSNVGRAPAIAASKSLTRQLIEKAKPHYEIAIATVYQDVKLVSPFGTEKDKRSDQLLSIKVDSGKGNTHLFSGLKTVIEDHLKTRPSKRKAIVLFSDGKDEEFQKDPSAGKSFQDELAIMAKENHITIHTIGYPESDDGNDALEPFNKLAEESGGSFNRCTPESHEPEDPEIRDALMKQIESGGSLNLILSQTDIPQEVRITLSTDKDETLTFIETVEPVPSPAPKTDPDASATPDQSDSSQDQNPENKDETAPKNRDQTPSTSESEKDKTFLGIGKTLLISLLLLTLVLIAAVVGFLLMRGKKSQDSRFSSINSEPLDLILADESNSAFAPDTIPDLPTLDPFKNPEVRPVRPSTPGIEQDQVFGVLQPKGENGKRISISKPLFVVGRSKTSDLVISNSSVSSVHGLIFSKNDQETNLIDLHSANGIFVNGKKVNKSCRLKDGDLIDFGEVAHVFREKKTSGSFQD